MAKNDAHKTGDRGRMTFEVRRITSCRRLVIYRILVAQTRLRGIFQKGWRTRGQLNLPAVGKSASSRNVQEWTTRRIDEPRDALGTQIRDAKCMRTVSEGREGATAGGR
eukprot:2139587-Pleurochrysis_carterae.AAC.1